MTKVKHMYNNIEMKKNIIFQSLLIFMFLKLILFTHTRIE